jgi:hypothetical protein
MGENDTGVWYTPSLHDCSLNVHNDREFFISANAGIRQMLCKQYNEADTMCSDTHHSRFSDTLALILPLASATRIVSPMSI